MVITPGDTRTFPVGSIMRDLTTDISFLTVVVSKKRTYGLSAEHKIMFCTGHRYETTTWEPVTLQNRYQSFKDIAVTTDGTLYAIDNSNGLLYVMEESKKNPGHCRMIYAQISRQIPLRCISCRDDKRIVAVAQEGMVIRLQTPRLVGLPHWVVLGSAEYKLKQIACGKKSTNRFKRRTEIWGVNSADIAVRWDEKNWKWIEMNVTVSGVEVTADNLCFATRKSDGKCLKFNGKQFVELHRPGRPLSRVNALKSKQNLFGIERDSGKAILVSSS